MACDKYIEWMSAALDGELTADERRELDGHLALCPQCAELFALLSRNANAARELDCELPSGLHERIMSNLPDQTAAGSKVVRWKRWGALAACLVLVVGAVLTMPLASRSFDAASAPESKSADGANFAPNAAAEAEVVSPESAPDPMEVPETDETDIRWSSPKCLQVGYDFASEAPSAVVIASARSLKEYLKDRDPGLFDEDGAPVLNPELEALYGLYPDDFFADRCLLAILLEEGSGSIGHELVSVTADEVTIRRVVPEAGTCDMVAWLILVELTPVLDDGATLTVHMLD